jgi:hypothetical protein
MGEEEEEENQGVVIPEILHDTTYDEDSKIVTFPSTITSGQRKVVHFIASDLNLYHVSKGEGESRYIQVSPYEISPDDDTSGNPSDSFYMMCQHSLIKPQSKVDIATLLINQYQRLSFNNYSPTTLHLPYLEYTLVHQQDTLSRYDY